MARKYKLPPNVREIRATGERNGRTHNPFVGAVDATTVYFPMRESDECHEVDLPELVTSAAEVAGCSTGAVLDWLAQRLGVSFSPCGPGGPVPTGASHGRPRRAR